MDAVEIGEDLVVPKPQNDSLRFAGIHFARLPRQQAMFGRRRFPRSAGPLGTQSRAHKVGNVAADRHLAAELATLTRCRRAVFADPLSTSVMFAVKCERALVLCRRGGCSFMSRLARRKHHPHPPPPSGPAFECLAGGRYAPPSSAIERR
jgi:hypothetical protein